MYTNDYYFLLCNLSNIISFFIISLWWNSFPGDNGNHGHQPRPWMLQDYRYRHGPRQQVGTGQHHGPGWQHRAIRSAWPWWYLCGHRLRPRPQSSLVATWATDINIYLSCGRIMDPNMVLGSILGSNVTIIPSGNTGHWDQHGPVAVWL